MQYDWLINLKTFSTSSSYITKFQMSVYAYDKTKHIYLKIPSSSSEWSAVFVDERFQRKLRKGLLERDRRLTLADDDWLRVKEVSPFWGVENEDANALCSAINFRMGTNGSYQQKKSFFLFKNEIWIWHVIHRKPL
jgi:hypothetical protein